MWTEKFYAQHSEGSAYVHPSCAKVVIFQSVLFIERSFQCALRICSFSLFVSTHRDKLATIFELLDTALLRMGHPASSVEIEKEAIPVVAQCACIWTSWSVLCTQRWWWLTCTSWYACGRGGVSFWSSRAILISVTSTATVCKACSLCNDSTSRFCIVRW